MCIAQHRMFWLIVPQSYDDRRRQGDGKEWGTQRPLVTASVRIRSLEHQISIQCGPPRLPNRQRTQDTIRFRRARRFLKKWPCIEVNCE